MNKLEGLSLLLNLRVHFDSCHVDEWLLYELPLLRFKAPELLDKAFVGVSLLSLGFDKLKDIVISALKDLHEEHDRASCRARHAHGTVYQHAILVTFFILINLVCKLLELVKQRILFVFGFADRLLLLHIDVQHHARNWVLIRASFLCIL